MSDVVFALRLAVGWVWQHGGPYWAIGMGGLIGGWWALFAPVRTPKARRVARATFLAQVANEERTRRIDRTLAEMTYQPDADDGQEGRNAALLSACERLYNMPDAHGNTRKETP